MANAQRVGKRSEHYERKVRFQAVIPDGCLAGVARQRPIPGRSLTDAAQSLDPSDINTLNIWGTLAYVLGRWSETIDAAQKAINLDR